MVNPDPPASVAEVEDSYEHPSGTVSAISLESLAERFAESARLLTETGNLNLLHGLTDQALDNETGLVSDTDPPVDPTHNARILGVVRISRTCRGAEGETEVDPEKNGRVTLIGKASNKGLFPVVWGELDRCHEHTAGGRSFTIEGEYFILLRRSESGFSRLVWFDGSITSGGLTSRGALSFLLRPDGGVELLLALSDGGVVVGVGEATQLVRDSVDEWRCRFNELECQSETTGNVVSASLEAL